jgi:hypothetical protein
MGGDAYGHRVLMVVDGVTPIRGDGNAVYRAKQDRSVSLLRILTYAKCGKWQEDKRQEDDSEEDS